ncbi:hypothetical protein [Treponema sp. R80B11-R83G3]
MEKINYFLEMISRFISGILPWSVVVLILFLVFKRSIKKILKKLTFIQITKDGLIIKLMDKFVNDLLDKEEGQKGQINPCPIDISDESDPLKLEILRTYSKIENAVKEKFGVSDSYNMFVSLSNEGKIDTTTLIILTSMELLRNEILSSTAHPKIIKENLNNY